MVDQLSIYNDALLILGERPIIDLLDNREPKQRLDAVWGFGAVEYCLEVIKPSFSKTIVQLNTPSPPQVSGFSDSHFLPADLITLVKVFSDSKLRNEVSDYYMDAGSVVCNYPTIYVRYVSSSTGLNFTLWTQSFARVVSSYMARELVVRFDSEAAPEIDATFNQNVKSAMALEDQREPSLRSVSDNTTLTTAMMSIYNDALQLIGLPHIASVTDDSVERGTLDVALGSGLVESLLEDTGWGWATSSYKMNNNPGLAPAWGFPWVFNEPPDYLRLVGVYTDEFMNSRLQDYKHESGVFYSHWNTLYLEYVSLTVLTSPSDWPKSFSRLVAAGLAKSACVTLNAQPRIIQRIDTEFNVRRKRAISNDVVQLPPGKLTQGSWVSARTQGRRTGRNQWI